MILTLLFRMCTCIPVILLLQLISVRQAPLKAGPAENVNVKECDLLCSIAANNVPK